MSCKNTLTSYGSISKFFHWSIACLVLFMLIYGCLLEDMPQAWQAMAYNIHKVIGVIVFLLMILALAWALINTKPMLPLETTAPERFTAHVVQYLLYLCVISMALSGWIGASAAGRPPHVGDLALLLPVPHNKAIVIAAFLMHGAIAIGLAFLITIHIMAAFFHHYIRKDEILKRMLPNRR